jgi:hypothetical protein
MKKYYKSYLLTESEEIQFSDLPNYQSYVVAEYNKDLDCMVSERLNYSGVRDWVIYYTNKPEEIVKEFHKSFRPDISLFSIFKRQKNGFILSSFKDGINSGHFIKIYDDLGRTKFVQEFNGDFELMEYKQSIYDDNGKLLQEKIFFADSWVIHTEDME